MGPSELSALCDATRRNVLRLVSSRRYAEADALTRECARVVYERVIKGMSLSELVRLVDGVTGGLAYRRGEWDVARMSYAGSIISWASVVRDGYRVLEIGTGLGRTCFAILSSADVEEYVTIDNSPEILAVALYGNLVDVYMRALWDESVRVLLGDAVRVVEAMRGEVFDHVVHDGGPNPASNPRLYSRRFLGRLASVLRRGGTMSVFAGRDPMWVDRIYAALASIGLRVKTESLPDSPVRVLHAVKSP